MSKSSKPVVVGISTAVAVSLGMGFVVGAVLIGGPVMTDMLVRFIDVVSTPEIGVTLLFAILSWPLYSEHQTAERLRAKVRELADNLMSTNGAPQMWMECEQCGDRVQPHQSGLCWECGRWRPPAAHWATVHGDLDGE